MKQCILFMNCLGILPLDISQEKKKKKHVKNLTAMQELQETWVQSLGWEDPLKDEMATHSSILD